LTSTTVSGTHPGISSYFNLNVEEKVHSSIVHFKEVKLYFAILLNSLINFFLIQRHRDAEIPYAFQVKYKNKIETTILEL